MQIIDGFSKLTRREQLEWLQKQAGLSGQTLRILDEHLHRDPVIQEIYGDLIENTVSNFYLPLGLAPNFMINEKVMILPMVIEESSVVAAASSAAKFWAAHGGFHTRVTGTSRVGQVHFTWSGSPRDLFRIFESNRENLLDSIKELVVRMEERGGGIKSMDIRATNPGLPDNYQLYLRINTSDAMGANFINSVLEHIASQFARVMKNAGKGEFEILMSILSNYTPESLVECYVEGETAIFDEMGGGLTAAQFTRKFRKALDVAVYDPNRAVTHNKGIFNGMDAVIMATGNDFRAVEACGHAYASRNGSYQSLSRLECSENTFRFILEVPLAVGTVGGLTGIHPMAAASLEILGKPTAAELMQIIAAAGLATNFSAIRALVTSGIQQGHMKMHLGNMLRQLKASKQEAEKAREHFASSRISFSDLASYLETLRKSSHQ